MFVPLAPTAHGVVLLQADSFHSCLHVFFLSLLLFRDSRLHEHVFSVDVAGQVGKRIMRGVIADSPRRGTVFFLELLLVSHLIKGQLD